MIISQISKLYTFFYRHQYVLKGRKIFDLYIEYLIIQAISIIFNYLYAYLFLFFSLNDLDFIMLFFTYLLFIFFITH